MRGVRVCALSRRAPLLPVDGSASSAVGATLGAPPWRDDRRREGDAVPAASADAVGATSALRLDARGGDLGCAPAGAVSGDAPARVRAARAVAAAVMDFEAEVNMPASASAETGEVGFSTRRRFALPRISVPGFAPPSFETPTLEADPRRARAVVVAGASPEVTRDDRRVTREGGGLAIARWGAPASQTCRGQ